MAFRDIKKGLYRFQEPVGGWVVVIKSAQNLLKAAEKARDAGVKHFDCFSPFPIHGLEKAMGLSRSWLPFITLCGGLTGMTFAFSAMTTIDTALWPSVSGGKPYFSWPAYIPITFELMVLFSAFFTLGGMIYLGRLGKTKRKPVVNTVTSDGFAIWLGDSMSKDDVKTLMGNLAVDIIETPENDLGGKK